MRRYIQLTSKTNPISPEVLKELSRIEGLGDLLSQGANSQGFYIVYYRCSAPERIEEVCEAMNPWGTAIECTGEEVSDHRLSLR